VVKVFGLLKINTPILPDCISASGHSNRCELYIDFDEIKI